MTNEQIKNRQLIVDWFDEIIRKDNINEHIERDLNDYTKYFELIKNSPPEEVCQRIVRFIGDESLGNVLYNYLDDYYTYKEYILYFQIIEDYEKCAVIQKIIEYLFEHINHIVECCRGENDDVKEGVNFLFDVLVKNLNNEFIKQYGL
jgi:hypothetical protein